MLRAKPIFHWHCELQKVFCPAGFKVNALQHLHTYSVWKSSPCMSILNAQFYITQCFPNRIDLGKRI